VLARSQGTDCWYPAMGVVCVQDGDSPDKTIQKLAEEGRAVVLMKPDGNGVYRADPAGVHHLVNFLIQRRYLAKAMEGCDFVNLNLLKVTPTPAATGKVQSPKPTPTDAEAMSDRGNK